MKARAKLLLAVLLCLRMTLGFAYAAYVFNQPVNFSNQQAWFSFGLGTGAVVPQTEAVYGLLQATFLNHVQVGYQYGYDYVPQSTAFINGTLTRIQGSSLALYQMWGNYGIYGGIHLEQTAAGSSVTYPYNNRSYNLYTLARLADDQAVQVTTESVGLSKETILYCGFRRTVFDSYTFANTGDNSIFQLVAGTHANGGDVVLGLGNFYAEINIEMSDFGHGSGDNIFGLNLGLAFDMFGPNNDDRKKQRATADSPETAS